MKLRQIEDFVENGKVTLFLRRAFSSYYFPLVTAVVVALCYMLAWDIVAIWYVCICATAILITCKDASPFLCLLLFVQIIISIKHCPSTLGTGSDYLFTAPILAQEIICVVFVSVALILRFVYGIVKGKFKPNSMFWGIVIFSVALLFNGLFYTNYSPKSLLYGFGLGVILVFVFIFACSNVTVDNKSFKRISFYLLALFGAAVVQLAFAYLTIDGLIVNGKVIRDMLFLGWGTYNNLGMLLTMCIPAWFYLAGKYKYGIFFLLGGLANLVAAYLSMSRQAMLMGTGLFIVCCVWLLIWDKGKKRTVNLCVMGAVLLILAICTAVFYEKVGTFFSSTLTSLLTGSGRTHLWDTSINNFLKKPLFGIGFFDPASSYNDIGYSGADITAFIPRLSHNTIFQLMSAGGLVALITYLFHRGQTIISLLSDFNHERILIALVLAAFLLCCLLDCYLFYFLHTGIYAFFVAVLAITEKKRRTVKRRLLL